MKIYIHINQPYAAPPVRFEPASAENPPYIPPPSVSPPPPIHPPETKTAPRVRPKRHRKKVEKAQRVIFEYTSNAKEVEITGGFVRWKPRPMDLNSLDNSWSLTLYLKPGTYPYHFLVEGKKTLDPRNPLQENDESILVVPEE